MITLHKLASGPSLDYIKKCLKTGNTLSQLVINNMALESGDIYAALPQGVDPSKALHFNHAVGCSPALSRQLLATDIIRYLKMQPRTVIFEDSLARATDPIIRRNPHGLNIMEFGGGIYYYLTPADVVTEKRIIQTITHAKDSSTTSYVCFFASVPNPTDLFQEEKRSFNNKIDCIAVGAFDRESYLLWKRK